MKAEINNENKAKFFAQYWGQKIFQGTYEVCGFNIDVISDKDYIELTPLLMISDEDALIVGKRYWPLLWERKGDQHLIDKIKRFVTQDKLTITNYLVDFLRSKGYALPWMGLSVDEMDEAGWIKLTEK